MSKRIFASQSEFDSARNRKNRRLEAKLDGRTPHFEMPEVSMCLYIEKCVLRKEKRCLFNSGYEECSGFKFYEKYPNYNEMFIGSTI